MVVDKYELLRILDDNNVLKPTPGTVSDRCTDIHLFFFFSYSYRTTRNIRTMYLHFMYPRTYNFIKTLRTHAVAHTRIPCEVCNFCVRIRIKAKVIREYLQSND